MPLDGRNYEAEAKTGVKADLIKAKDLIADPKDWCGYGWQGDHGTICVLHALNKVFGKNGDVDKNTKRHREMVRVLSVGFNRYVSLDCSEIGWFNDHRSHADVIAALNGSIASLP